MKGEFNNLTKRELELIIKLKNSKEFEVLEKLINSRNEMLANKLTRDLLKTELSEAEFAKKATDLKIRIDENKKVIQLVKNHSVRVFNLKYVENK